MLQIYCFIDYPSKIQALSSMIFSHLTLQPYDHVTRYEALHDISLHVRQYFQHKINRLKFLFFTSVIAISIFYIISIIFIYLNRSIIN